MQDKNNKEELLQAHVAPVVYNFKTFWHEQQHILETNTAKKQMTFVKCTKTSTDKEVNTDNLDVNSQVTTSQSKKDVVTPKKKKKRKRRQKVPNQTKQHNRPEELIETPPHNQSKKAKAKRRTGNRNKQKQSGLFRGNMQKNGSGSSQSSSSSDENTGASAQPTHTFTKRLDSAIDTTQSTTNPETRKVIGSTQSQQAEKSSGRLSVSKTAKIQQETASPIPFVEQIPCSQSFFETSVTTPRDETIDDSLLADPEITPTLSGESTNLTVTEVPAISSETSASDNASSSSTSSESGMEIPQKVLKFIY